jgi:hypothetical protein
VKLGDRAAVRSKKSKPDRFNRLRDPESRFVVTPEGFDGIKQMVARSFELIATDVHG